MKNDVFVGSSGIPSVHFLVSIIAFVEECPIRCYQSSRSFICWKSFGERFVVNGGSVVGTVADSGSADAVEVAIDSVGMVVDTDGIAAVVPRLSPTI